jgi:hypothetical protein
MNITSKYKNDLDWFIGFSEGDGSWQVDNTGNPIFIINQQDPQILYKIKKLIGYGTITGPYFNKNAINSYHRYRVANLKGTEKLIGIFNGNLVLNKTKHRFSEYLDAFNNYYSEIGNDINKQIHFDNKTIRPTLEDAWLSGFIDSEGCFNCVVVKNKITKEPSTVSLRITLVQKSEPEVFKYLKSLLHGALQHEVKKDAYRLSCNSVKSRNIILDYLLKYPLKSKKTIAYSRFKKLHVRITDGKFNWRLQNRRARQRLFTLASNINKDIY